MHIALLNARQSWILDPISWIPGAGFQSFSVELGFWIPFLSGFPDSMNCILDFKTQDSGFNEQNFPGFRVLQAKIYLQIPLPGANYSMTNVGSVCKFNRIFILGSCKIQLETAYRNLVACEY